MSWRGPQLFDGLWNLINAKETTTTTTFDRILRLPFLTQVPFFLAAVFKRSAFGLVSGSVDSFPIRSDQLSPLPPVYLKLGIPIFSRKENWIHSRDPPTTLGLLTGSPTEWDCRKNSTESRYSKSSSVILFEPAFFFISFSSYILSFLPTNPRPTQFVYSLTKGSAN